MKTEVVETVNKRGQGWTKLASREMEVWTFSTPERALDSNILTRPSRKSREGRISCSQTLIQEHYHAKYYLKVWTFSSSRARSGPDIITCVLRKEKGSKPDTLTCLFRKREKIGYPAPKILSKNIILRNIISKFGRFPARERDSGPIS